MRDTIALVLAGGRVGDFGVLTQHRPKGALTFAGSYRIVDFALSALRQAGIDRIGIIIQYLPASLIEHVGVGAPWDLQGFGRALKVMPPFIGIDATDWYKGTADALLKNFNFVRDQAPDNVVVLSGEQVYHLDFQDVLARHRATGAEITVVTKQMDPDRCTSRFGYVDVGDGGRVTGFIEKPASDFPHDVISAGIFVFKRQVLAELLQANANEPEHNLAKHVLEPRVGEYDAREYRMAGYWEYLADTADYHQVHMRLVRESPGHPSDLEELRRWGTLTNLEYRGQGFAPPAKFGRGARVAATLASPGVVIGPGAIVEECVLSPGVAIGANARVKGCVLMHDANVGEGASLERVVADKDADFGPGCHVGGPAPAPLTVAGKAAQVMPGARVDPGAEIAPIGESLAMLAAR